MKLMIFFLRSKKKKKRGIEIVRGNCDPLKHYRMVIYIFLFSSHDLITGWLMKLFQQPNRRQGVLKFNCYLFLKLKPSYVQLTSNVHTMLGRHLDPCSTRKPFLLKIIRDCEWNNISREEIDYPSQPICAGNVL